MFVIENNSNVTWPSNSLEIYVLTFSRFCWEVNEIIYGYLGNITVDFFDNHWNLVIERVRDGMVKRQLLNAVKQKSLKKTLKVFTKIHYKAYYEVHYKLPESTIALAAQQSIEPIQQLLTKCKQTRPEIWRLLVKEVFFGVNRHIDFSWVYAN